MSTQTYIVAIDCGKDSTKYAINSKGNNLTFKSFLTRIQAATGYEESDIGTVEYDGNKYAYGDAVQARVTSDFSSKKDVTHKICTLIAIAKMVPNNSTVHACIGCPLSIYPNKDARREYLEYILPKGEHKIIVDGKEKKFFIAKTKVYAESTGILMLEPRRFKDENVGILDIGGLNVNGAYLTNGSLITESCFTEKLGSGTLISALQSQLNSKYDLNILPEQMDVIIKHGAIKKIDGSREYIREFFASHFDRIIKTCENNRWDRRLIDLVFIGGTSLLLKDYILDKFSQDEVYIPENANFSNVLGFLGKFTHDVAKAEKKEK